MQNSPSGKIVMYNFVIILMKYSGLQLVNFSLDLSESNCLFFPKDSSFPELSDIILKHVRIE